MSTRIFAAAVAAIAWIGLATQFHASFVQLQSVASTLWEMLFYFTVIVNLMVAVVFTAAALGLSRIATPFALGGVTIAILLVGIVYNTLLNGMVELSGGAKLADVINHSVTPVTVTLFWVFVAEKGRLRWRHPAQWAALPVAYFVYGLVRGAARGQYPYPFMNVDRLGWGQTMVNALVMAFGFMVVGYAMVGLDGRLSRRTPDDL